MLSNAAPATTERAVTNASARQMIAVNLYVRAIFHGLLLSIFIWISNFFPVLATVRTMTSPAPRASQARTGCGRCSRRNHVVDNDEFVLAQQYSAAKGCSCLQRVCRVARSCRVPFVPCRAAVFETTSKGARRFFVKARASSFD